MGRGGKGTSDAVVRIGGDDKRLDGTLGSSRRKLKKWAVGVKTDVSRALGGAFSSLQNLAGFGGVATLAIAGRNVLQFEKRLVRLRIAARASATDMATLKKAIFETGGRTGVDPDQLLGGVERFVQLTGKFDVARASLETFARVAAASGAEVEDIAVTAASLNQQLGIDPSEMEKAFSILIRQGKDGAIELKGLAQIVEGLTPTFRQFGNEGAAGLAEMGALLQMMKQGFGGEASETATGLASLMGVVLKQQKRLRDAGAKLEIVDPKTKKRTLKNLTDIIFEIDRVAEKRAKSRGQSKASVLAELIGDKEAIKAVLPVLDQGRDRLDELVLSGLKANDVQEDFATFSESAGAAMERQTAQLKALANATIAKHANSIAKAFAAIVKALSWIADHPVTSLGILGLLKGGGFLARAGMGLTDALAGGAAVAGGGAGGGGAAGPVYGPMTRAEWARSNWWATRYGGRGSFGDLGLNAATPGRMLQGAGIGMLVASQVSDGPMANLHRGALVASNALAGLPGPLGVVAKGAAVAGDALTLYFEHLNEEIDQANKRRETAQFGEFGFERGGELAQARATIAYYRGAGGPKTAEQQAALDKAMSTRRSTSEYFLRRLDAIGALKRGEGGEIALDRTKLMNEIASDPDIGDQESFARKAEAALKTIGEDPIIGQIADELVSAREGRTQTETIRKQIEALEAKQAAQADLKVLAERGIKVGVKVEVKDGQLVPAVENDRRLRRQ